MTVHRRRVWRAATSTLVVVWAFMLVAGSCIPLLAYLIYFRERQPLIPSLLGGLTLAALLYAWRFGLHPRLKAGPDSVVIKNPFRTYFYNWDDVTLIAPGENGLLIGSQDSQSEAWCIQKSNRATKKGSYTRADRVCNELHNMLDDYDPPLEDQDTGLRIRRARPGEEVLLMRMERATSEASFSHIFPADQYPYPSREVTKRWRKLLRDRLMSVRILELFDAPVGYLAYKDETIRHLGVVPHQTRRGYGSALLEYACQQIFDSGCSAAELWVLTDNRSARDFYAAAGWRDTDDRRACEFEPFPEERRLMRRNPRAPRRSRS